MSPEKKSEDALRATAAADQDADLDRMLREIGKDLLQQEIPERLRRVLREVPDAPDKARPENQAEGPQDPPDGSSKTPGK